MKLDGQYTWIVTNIGTNQEYYNVTFENITLPSFELTNNSNIVDSTYVIQLIVGDGNNCTAQSTDTIVIHPLPLADFVVQNQSCYDQELTIDNQSIFANTVSYNWSASPELYISNINQSSPLINFPLNASGSSVFYNLTVEIEDQYNCSNVTTETIEVFTNPIADFSIPSAACGDTTLTIENNSSFENTYLWSIPNNNPIYTCALSGKSRLPMKITANVGASIPLNQFGTYRTSTKSRSKKAGNLSQNEKHSIMDSIFTLYFL